MNNCLGWILAIAFTFISPHGTSSSVSQHTLPTTDPGSALHRNIILHSAAKKEVLASWATHWDISTHDCFTDPLCFSCVNNHLKLMKLWLIGWNVLHCLGGLGGLALCLPHFLQAADAGHGWISSVMRRSNDRTNYKHLRPLNGVVSVTWAKTVGGGGFCSPFWVWRGKREPSTRLWLWEKCLQPI